ncbi:hypothetical protein OF829_19310 [Sphingomonas sp. LB-2]|uniref:hypothetical protein n=1 Tax=Sphingomonas caeni TaxID=2984949 RepID=UPI0022317D69|nr:hypothetical protein [Sphingomonas caeni]MCW3849394.1 hypothetical protein [Sphingomonas caeni]
MPKINWRVICAVVGGLAALVGGIGYGLSEQSRYEQEAKYWSADYARKSADEIAQSCLIGTRLEQAKCLENGAAEQRLKTRDNQREYEDLAAQRTSALWTSIMGVAALIGMFLSAVGVALVWTTFRATREANTIARDAVQGELRPWIRFTIDGSLWGRITKIDGGGYDVVTDVTFKNIGNSPAIGLSYCASIVFSELNREHLLSQVAGWFDVDGEDWRDKTLFQGDEWERKVGAIVVEECTTRSPVLVIAARYRSPFSDIDHFTVRVFDMRDTHHRTDDVVHFRDDLRAVKLADKQHFAGTAT